tara:strand:- start:1138 stop:2907 length:1770 start_codon:yes stop_codon:yes gene_type:complete
MVTEYTGLRGKAETRENLPQSHLYQSDSLEDISQQIFSSIDSYVAVDTETTGLKWYEDRSFGVALAWDTQKIFIRNSQFGEKNIGKFLSDLYKSEKTVVMHNAEFDIHMIRESYGVEEFPNSLIDTLRVSHILDTSADHSLKGWSETIYGDIASYWESLVTEYRKKYKIKSYDLLPPDILDPYAANDAHLTKVLAYRFVPRVMSESPKIFELEHALIPAIVDMEKEGLKIDLDYIYEQQQTLLQSQFKVEQKIFDLVGKNLNPGSPKMISDYLYKQCGLPVVYNDEGRPTTNNEALESIDHPVADAILEWRTVAKEENTYYSPYLQHEHKGRVYPHWNMCGTRSGRMSSSSPNAQNVPKRSDARRMFVPDGMFIDIDYSQIELRMLAHASNDEVLVDAFNTGKDLHTLTASNIYKTDMDSVTKTQRDNGKTVNFAIIYGAGAGLIAKNTNVDLEQGEDFRRQYWNSYPEVEKYNWSVRKKAERQGYVSTLFGRRLPVESSKNALNYSIQGSAADLMKVALVRCWKYAKENGGSIRNVVHDELLFDNLEESHIPKLQELMEDFSFVVPTTTEAQVSKESWRDLKTWEKKI